jgi:hypothetical protein
MAAEAIELPPVVSGIELARQSSTAQQWAVEGLLAPGQSVLLAAQKKSGKTTTVLNLIRSLTTGEPFLGEYKPVRRMRVAYFDTELRFETANSYVGQLGIPRDWLEYVACAEVGIQGLVPHGLRHTTASLAISAGANVKVVQRMLGHATANMTLDLYGHLLNGDLTGVADALGKAIETTAVSLRYEDAEEAKAG